MSGAPPPPPPPGEETTISLINEKVLCKMKGRAHLATAGPYRLPRTILQRREESGGQIGNPAQHLSSRSPSLLLPLSAPTLLSTTSPCHVQNSYEGRLHKTSVSLSSRKRLRLVECANENAFKHLFILTTGAVAAGSPSSLASPIASLRAPPSVELASLAVSPAGASSWPAGASSRLAGAATSLCFEQVGGRVRNQE